ncbi:hypothetical protein REPUB_Repub09cG0109100 [Reevesia pubescens]
MGGCATKPKVLKNDEGEVPAPVPPPEPTKDPVPAVPEAKEVGDIAAEGEKKVETDVVHEVVKAKDVDESKEEVVNDDQLDDQANKRQSLSILFKEKGAAESDNTSSEPTKNESLEPVKQELSEPVKEESVEPMETESLEPVQIKSVEPLKQEGEKEAPSDTDKLKETYATTNQENEEPAKPIDQTYKPAPVSIASGKIESAQPIEAKAAPEAAAALNVPETQNKETSSDDKEGKTEVAK